MKNFMQKVTFILASVLTLTVIFGGMRANQVKAWTNLTMADFNTAYEISGEDEVTFKFSLPSSGKLTQLTSVTNSSLHFYIKDADGNNIETLYGESVNNYSYDMDLIGGDYFIVADGYYFTKASVKWIFTPSEESFNENQDERNNDLTNPFPIELSGTTKGQLARNDNADYYSFTTKKMGALSLRLTAKMQGVSISLVNEEGSINFSEKKIAKGTKTFTFQIPEGNYFLMVGGEYTGNYSFKPVFVQSPAKTKIQYAKNLKKAKLQVSWKKAKSVDGYEVQISTSDLFDRYVTTKTVKGSNKTSVTFKGLSFSTYSPYEYYSRVRTYKTIKGIKAYSDWSEELVTEIKK